MANSLPYPTGTPPYPSGITVRGFDSGSSPNPTSPSQLPVGFQNPFVFNPSEYERSVGPGGNLIYSRYGTTQYASYGPESRGPQDYTMETASYKTEQVETSPAGVVLSVINYEPATRIVYGGKNFTMGYEKVVGERVSKVTTYDANLMPQRIETRSQYNQDQEFGSRDIQYVSGEIVSKQYQDLPKGPPQPQVGVVTREGLPQKPVDPVQGTNTMFPSPVPGWRSLHEGPQLLGTEVTFSSRSSIAEASNAETQWRTSQRAQREVNEFIVGISPNVEFGTGPKAGRNVIDVTRSNDPVSAIIGNAGSENQKEALEFANVSLQSRQPVVQPELQAPGRLPSNFAELNPLQQNVALTNWVFGTQDLLQTAYFNEEVKAGRLFPATDAKTGQTIYYSKTKTTTPLFDWNEAAQTALHGPPGMTTTKGQSVEWTTQADIFGQNQPVVITRDVSPSRILATNLLGLFSTFKAPQGEGGQESVYQAIPPGLRSWVTDYEPTKIFMEAGKNVGRDFILTPLQGGLGLAYGSIAGIVSPKVVQKYVVNYPKIEWKPPQLSWQEFKQDLSNPVNIITFGATSKTGVKIISAVGENARSVWEQVPPKAQTALMLGGFLETSAYASQWYAGRVAISGVGLGLAGSEAKQSVEEFGKFNLVGGTEHALKAGIFFIPAALESRNVVLETPGRVVGGAQEFLEPSVFRKVMETEVFGRRIGTSAEFAFVPVERFSTEYVREGHLPKVNPATVPAIFARTVEFQIPEIGLTGQGIKVATARSSGIRTPVGGGGGLPLEITPGLGRRESPSFTAEQYAQYNRLLEETGRPGFNPTEPGEPYPFVVSRSYDVPAQYVGPAPDVSLEFLRLSAELEYQGLGVFPESYAGAPMIEFSVANKMIRLPEEVVYRKGKQFRVEGDVNPVPTPEEFGRQFAMENVIVESKRNVIGARGLGRDYGVATSEPEAVRVPGGPIAVGRSQPEEMTWVQRLVFGKEAGQYVRGFTVYRGNAVGLQVAQPGQLLGPVRVPLMRQIDYGPLQIGTSPLQLDFQGIVSKAQTESVFADIGINVPKESPEPVAVFYHGTKSEQVGSILKEGLKPAEQVGLTRDLITGEYRPIGVGRIREVLSSEQNVFVTPQFELAKIYSNLFRDEGGGSVIKIEIPVSKLNKIYSEAPSTSFVDTTLNASYPKPAELGISDYSKFQFGEFRIPGKIAPEYLSVVEAPKPVIEGNLKAPGPLSTGIISGDYGVELWKPQREALGDYTRFGGSYIRPPKYGLQPSVLGLLSESEVMPSSQVRGFTQSSFLNYDTGSYVKGYSPSRITGSYTAPSYLGSSMIGGSSIAASYIGGSSTVGRSYGGSSRIGGSSVGESILGGSSLLGGSYGGSSVVGGSRVGGGASYLWAGITEPPKVYPREYPRPSSKGQNWLNKAFVVQVKRKGKFKTIASGLPRGLALQFGSKKVKGTLAATFRLKEQGVTETPDVEFQPSSRIFRTYQIKKGIALPLDMTFIQKRGTRLGSGGERTEIKYAKIARRLF